MRTPVAALVLEGMLAAAIPAQAQTQGVTDTEIVVGITTPLSGPAAAWGNTAVAAEAWAKPVNAQGGSTAASSRSS